MKVEYFLLISVLLFSHTVWAGGTIEGKVYYRGNPPKAQQYGIVQNTKVCGTSKYTKNFLVHKSHGIQNVVISVDHLKGLKAASFHNAVVTFRGCEIYPYITLVSTSGNVTVINGDSLTHQFHTKSLRDPPKNVTLTAALTKARSQRQFEIRHPEILKLKVDLRDWMTGYLFVTDLPYTVVTNQEGSFKIVDVPEGRYVLKGWHEKLGFFSKRVKVREGKVIPVKWVIGHKID
jgi:hypothetical protein